MGKLFAIAAVRKTPLFDFIVAWVLLFSSHFAVAARLSCEGQFVDVSVRSNQNVAKTAAQKVDSAAELNLKKFENIFSRARDLSRYKIAFGKEFSQALRGLSEKGGHWIDAGAGDAIAIQEFVAANPLVRGTAISIESSAESSERLMVIKGQFIENIASGYVTKARVITDLIGGLAYSGTPHLILRKYFDWLDSNGEIFVYMGTRDVYGLKNRVITADGKYLNVVEWIKQIPGIKVDVLVETREDEGVLYQKWAMRLTRDLGQTLNIPDVTLREFQAGAPPTMLFQELARMSVGAGESALLDTQRRIRSEIQLGLRKSAQTWTFTSFMDSFRGGEITHPLVAAVANLKSGQTWVNISPFGVNLKEDLAKRSYDASSDKVFFGASQKWIRFRINAIRPERFRYQHFLTAAALGNLKDVGVLTDMNGDFASGLQPDKALHKYIQAIGDSGTIFLFLGPEYTGFGASSGVLTEKGKRLSLRAWLKSIRGLEIKLFRGGYAYTGGQWTFVRIRKTQSTVVIPHLKFLGADNFTEGEIPSMIFQEGQ